MSPLRSPLPINALSPCTYPPTYGGTNPPMSKRSRENPDCSYMVQAPSNYDMTTELSTLTFWQADLPVLKAVSLSPYFKRNLPVFENIQFSNIQVIASL